MGAMLMSIAWIFYNAGATYTLAPQKLTNSPVKVAIVTIVASSFAACLVFIGQPIVNFFGKEEGNTFDPIMLISC